jgi:hypothetical protein
VIVRWSLGKTDHCQGSRKEPCTRATPRGSSSHARHRSALTTVRLHNRQWRGERSTLRDGVKTFSCVELIWAKHAICEAFAASLGVETVRREKMAGRVVSSRYEHTWEAPKDGIVTRMGPEVEEKTRELDENGPWAGRGPVHAPGFSSAEAAIAATAADFSLLGPP